MKIVNHLLNGGKFVRSPNMGGVINPRFIVMHYTAGWTAESAIATLTNPKSSVSAQFVIDRDGSITQLVPCNRRAWHAGPSKYQGYSDLNSHSIGIEFVNPGYFKQGPNGQVLDSAGKAIPAKRLEGYDLSIKAANAKIGGGVFIWPKYTDAQLAAGRELVKALCAEYDILDVCNHEDIDTRGWKTDAGVAFPISEFRAMVHKLEGRNNGDTALGSANVVRALNCRTAPLITAPILTVLKAGQEVAVVKRGKEWSQIEFAPGRTGFVSDQYLIHET